MKVLFRDSGSNHLAVTDFKSVSVYNDHSAIAFETDIDRTFVLPIFKHNDAYCVNKINGDIVSSETIIRQVFSSSTLDLSDYLLIEVDEDDE